MVATGSLQNYLVVYRSSEHILSLSSYQQDVGQACTDTLLHDKQSLLGFVYFVSHFLVQPITMTVVGSLCASLEQAPHECLAGRAAAVGGMCYSTHATGCCPLHLFAIEHGTPYGCWSSAYRYLQIHLCTKSTHCVCNRQGL
jgi:hypothetical protein